MLSPLQFFVLSGEQLQFPGKGTSALPRLSGCRCGGRTAVRGEAGARLHRRLRSRAILDTHRTSRALFSSTHGRSPSPAFHPFRSRSLGTPPQPSPSATPAIRARPSPRPPPSPRPGPRTPLPHARHRYPPC